MDAKEIAKALQRPFPVRTVKWKPAKTSGDRALAVAYIDARDVMRRLDAVVGPFSWGDQYRVLQVGNETVIECTLTLIIGDIKVCKADVGETAGSDFTSGAKTGYSDALKRAAVKYGVGRYLYYLPARWVGYDPQKKQLTEMPKLPVWAIPQEERKLVPESKQKKESESEPKGEPHWITDPLTEHRFQKWTRAELGITDDEVLAALGVDNVLKFKGSMDYAKFHIEEWVKAQAEAEDTTQHEQIEEIPY